MLGIDPAGFLVGVVATCFALAGRWDRGVLLCFGYALGCTLQRLTH